MECFGLVASGSLVRPDDSAFFKPHRGPNNAPKVPYGTELNFTDYSKGYGGYRPIDMTWSYIEATDAKRIYEIWDDARVNHGSRVWVNYYDVLAGEWRVNSAVMLEPKENGFIGTIYQNFSFKIVKISIHTQNYRGGASPFIYSGTQYVYGDKKFTNDGFELPKPGI
jgi:hypothetical protein